MNTHHHPGHVAGRVRRAARAVIALIFAGVLAFVVGAVPAAGMTGHSAAIAGAVLGINDDPDHAMDDPLAGASVSVVSAATGHRLGSAVTDGLGRFRVSGLPAIAVKVKVTKDGFLGVWADNQKRYAAATSYRLHRGQTTVIPGEQVLYAEAVISGQVLENFDPPSDPTRVEVFDAVTHRRLAWTDVPAGEGNYEIRGLPAATIKVHAYPLAGLWTDSWASGQHSWATADTYDLWAGRHLAQSWDVPIVLYLDLGYAGQVTGRVTGGGKPIANSTVSVLDPSGATIATGHTNAKGCYRVRFSDWSGLQVKVKAAKDGWQPAYANGKTSFETADLIFVDSQHSVALPPLVLTR